MLDIAINISLQVTSLLPFLVALQFPGTCPAGDVIGRQAISHLTAPLNLSGDEFLNGEGGNVWT